MAKTNKVQKVKAEPTTEIAGIAPGSPAAIMMELASSSSDFDIEKFGKMLEYQERFEANEARKVYASGFAAVQSKIEAVVKTEVNPQTKSKYAGLDGVIEMAKPVYTEQGFSIIYYEGETKVADHIRVCADVLHKSGHKETYHYDVPLGGVGIQGKVNMTKIHAKATSVTYGRRYLLCMIWNIPTADDDGNVADKPPLELPDMTDENKETIQAIYAVLEESLDAGLTLDHEKVCNIFFAQKGVWPEDVERAGAAAAWLIGLKMEDSWTRKIS